LGNPDEANDRYGEQGKDFHNEKDILNASRPGHIHTVYQCEENCKDNMVTVTLADMGVSVTAPTTLHGILDVGVRN